MSDPRVLRTRQALTEAIFELIQHKRWQSIRVQDILDRSGVSRSAFYAHFDNQYDLLTSAIPSLMTDLGDVDPDDPGRPPDLQPLFAHVDHMAPVLRPLMKQPVLSDVVRSFEEEIAETLRRRLPAGQEVTARFLAGALTAVLREHVTGRSIRPSARVCRETQQLFGLVFARAYGS